MRRTLIQDINVDPLETLARLVTHFRDYHPIEPCRATPDVDAGPPAYVADFQDIKGQEYTQKQQLGPSLSRGRGKTGNSALLVTRSDHL